LKGIYILFIACWIYRGLFCTDFHYFGYCTRGKHPIVINEDSFYLVKCLSIFDDIASMDKYSKLLKSNLEKIPGVTVKLNNKFEPSHASFLGVKNNLNFFISCMTRVITSLKRTQEIIVNLEEFYRNKMDGFYYESELEVFQIIVNSELFKIIDIHESTKYKGISLLDKKSKKYICHDELFIDVFSDKKFKIDFSFFNLNPDSNLSSEAGINLGAKNKLIDLNLIMKKTASKSGADIFKSSFFNDFDFYRFNIERMLDKALSISATLESKLMNLNFIEESLDFKKKNKKQKINFLALSKHIEEDSKKIAQYV
jgi:phosphotransferase system IIB component